MSFTPNINLETPVNGSNVGVWDQPMNLNFNKLDSVIGGVTTVAITNLNIVLSAAQYANNFIVFTGTQTGNVTISFPAVGRSYVVLNNCVSNTSFVIACAVVGVPGAFICAPPNEAIQIFSDGTNMRPVGLGRVGEYFDCAFTSVPLWISASTPAPYLNCTGASFSSATYPALRDYLGTNVLPDSTGRFRATLNQGSARLTGTAGLGGLNGESSGFLSGGGTQQIGQTNIPNYALPVTDPGHTHVLGLGGGVLLAGGGTINVDATGANPVPLNPGSISATGSNTTGITVASGGSGSAYAPPAYVGGLTLIRAG